MFKVDVRKKFKSLNLVKRLRMKIQSLKYLIAIQAWNLSTKADNGEMLNTFSKKNKDYKEILQHTAFVIALFNFFFKSELWGFTWRFQIPCHIFQMEFVVYSLLNIIHLDLNLSVKLQDSYKIVNYSLKMKKNWWQCKLRWWIRDQVIKANQNTNLRGLEKS